MMKLSKTKQIWGRLIAVITVMISVGIADDQTAKDNGKKNEATDSKLAQPAKTTDLIAADKPQGLGAFGMMLPLGQKNLDVKIPAFKNGLPSSLIRASSMTRIDDEFMEMEKLDIRLFGEERGKDVRVQLVTGEYHMPSQLLSSEQRSRISREDFQLEGDKLVFDTKTQQGKVTGNVKMIIFDSSSFTGLKDEQAMPKEIEASFPEKATNTPKIEPNKSKVNDKK